MPEELLYKEGEAESGFDVVVCSACMIKGHFTNACYEEFLKVLRPGGYMIFTIRDIYIDSKTDNGMDFAGKMKELMDSGKMIHVDTVKFIKYKGL